MGPSSIAQVAAPPASTSDAIVALDGFEGPAVEEEVAGEEIGNRLWSGALEREVSGATGYAYADGAASAGGVQHARVPADTFVFTYWGDEAPNEQESFPATGGFTTQVRVYLDTAWAADNPGQDVDYTTALTRPDGTHLRDFIFNLQTTEDGFAVDASNNVIPPGFGVGPVHVVEESGWYTLQHQVSDADGDGVVDVQMSLLDASGAAVATWELGGDAMSSVGSVYYSWFVQHEVPDLPVDETRMIQYVGSVPGLT